MSLAPRPRLTLASLVVTGLVALLAAPALQAQAAGPWSIHAAGVYYSPTGDSSDDFLFVDSSRGDLAVDGSDIGPGLFVGYRLGHRWSLEAGAFRTNLDGRYQFESPPGVVRFTSSDALDIETYLVGVDFHLLPGSRAGFTLGAFVAQSSFDDLAYPTDLGNDIVRSFDDETSFGVKVGGTWDFASTASGGAWFLSLDGRYMPLTIEAEVPNTDGHEIDLDPLMVSVGFGYRF